MWSYGKKGIGSRVFDALNTGFMILLSVVTIYPFLFVLFASFSEPMALMAHRGLLLHPLGFSLKGYELVFNNNDILNGYGVTAFLVVAGTVLNMLMTILFAYVLSRRNMLWNRMLTVMVIITMYFGGGMIPSFLVIKGLGLYDSIWALILPNLISTYNLIIMRTAISAVPGELEESARLDGAGELRVLFNIILPACIPTIAALGLFYAVGYWNSWSSALVYIKSPDKYPLQLVLRSVLVQNNTGSMTSGEAMYQAGMAQAYTRLLKYSTVIVSIVPIMMVYPFLQKHFTQGMMIGAVKG